MVRVYLAVAWALSNREDQAALVEVLELRKLELEISPKILLSDCAEQYYTAWVGVFEGRSQSYCARGTWTGHGERS